MSDAVIEMAAVGRKCDCRCQLYNFLWRQSGGWSRGCGCSRLIVAFTTVCDALLYESGHFSVCGFFPDGLRHLCIVKNLSGIVYESDDDR